MENLQRKLAEGEISNIAKLAGTMAGIKDIDVKVSLGFFFRPFY